MLQHVFRLSEAAAGAHAGVWDKKCGRAEKVQGLFNGLISIYNYKLNTPFKIKAKLIFLSVNKK